MKNLYCPMIHGGLNINLKHSGQMSFNQCCLSTSPLQTVSDTNDIWNNKKLIEIRDTNNQNVWDKGCWECERTENSGSRSFRQAMIDKFGEKRNQFGPQRIDLLFDRGCNLACMTCGPNSSTFWQKHLKENNLHFYTYSNESNMDKIFNILKSLDLSNLEMIQFCGGEPLLGNTYWDTAKFISELVPDSHNKIDLSFNTNGTQPLSTRHFDIIERFKLVKFIISIDGTFNKFEYLRWPANWNQMTENIMNIRENAPVNVMFMIQEVFSSLNLFYFDEAKKWAANNFSINRLGDPVDYNFQLAIHKDLNINNITEEYYSSLPSSAKLLIKNHWQENPAQIKEMLARLDKFDKIRNQSWKDTFPEVAGFYNRYF